MYSKTGGPLHPSHQFQQNFKQNLISSNNPSTTNKNINMAVRYFSPKRILLALLIISLWSFAIYYHLTHKMVMTSLNNLDLEDPEMVAKAIEIPTEDQKLEMAREQLTELLKQEQLEAAAAEEKENNEANEHLSWKERVELKKKQEHEDKVAERKFSQEAKYAEHENAAKFTGGTRYGPDGKIIERVEGEPNLLNSDDPAERQFARSQKALNGRVTDANQGLNTKGIENCPFETNSDYAEDFSDIEPYLKNIRRDHYLLNLSPFGPNNQLRGFRDTFVLAILLNRTIVMPPFFKHRTDPSSRRAGYLYQDPQQKLDGVEIAKMMPVITLNQYADRCRDGLDVVFLARKNSNTTEFGRLSFYEKILNFDIMVKPYRRGGPALLAPTVINPRTYRKRNREESYVSLTKMSASIAYGPGVEGSNDGACALWLEPYRNMLMTQHLSGWAKRPEEPWGPEFADTLTERPGELVARMMNATVRAKSVRSAMEDFRAANWGDKTYVAMHWRYDAADFGKHCSKGFGGQGICGLVEQTDPKTVGERLGHFIDYRARVNLENKERALAMNLTSFASSLVDKIIYIAAPPAEAPQIEKMKTELLEEGITVYYGEDLMKFLKNRHSKCPEPIMRDEIHDFISLTEMELCSKSDLFIYSGGSSWSRNILMERQTVRKHQQDLENSRFMAKDVKAAEALSSKGGSEEG